jgi:poly(3-hydroxybutyrate) depolymerase
MYKSFFNFNNLYSAEELGRTSLIPFRAYVQTMLHWYANNNAPAAQYARAYFTILERITRRYKTPEFGITKVVANDKTYSVEQKAVLSKAFCRLQHFAKTGFKEKQEKLLIVAPMAGHHATLLRRTVQDLLPFFDVYITDWTDAKLVPLEQGYFDMDDYIDYVIEFIKFLGPNTNVMAVCQPTVPVLAAAAIMSENKDPAVPSSLILIGGPIDASQNPTVVNTFATGKPIEWFERNVITHVPANYPGYMRKVFPGFMQLAGFMSINLERHVNAHIELFHQLASGDQEAADRQMKFYDEYFATMDLTAEFYLQTIKEVFQDYAMAKGTLVSRGRKIDLKSITKSSLLGIEGEKDDIAGVGQTKAALNLCAGIPTNKKKYILQADVGHYGAFSGSKFRKFIVPAICDFVYTASK